MYKLIGILTIFLPLTAFTVEKQGKAFSFVSCEEIVSPSATAFDNLKSFAIEVNLINNGSGLQGIVSKRKNHNEDQAFSLFLLNNKVYFKVNEEGTYFHSNFKLENGKTYNIKAVFDGSQPEQSRKKIYINGKLSAVGRSEYNVLSPSSHELEIGKLSGNKYSDFQGRLIDLKVLSSSYDQGDGTIAYYKETRNGNACGIQKCNHLGDKSCERPNFAAFQSQTNPANSLIGINSWKNRNFEEHDLSSGKSFLPGEEHASHIHGQLLLTVTNNLAKLSWEPSDEIQLNGYAVVEQKTDNDFWVNIGSFDLRNDIQKYDYSVRLDERNKTKIFYRLKFNNMNGTYAYSNVATLPLVSKKKEEVTVFPNPFNDVIYLSLSEAAKSGIEVELSDASGKVILSKSVQTRVMFNQVTIPANELEEGIYLIRIKYDGKVIVKKLVK